MDLFDTVLQEKRDKLQARGWTPLPPCRGVAYWKDPAGKIWAEFDACDQLDRLEAKPADDDQQ